MTEIWNKTNYPMKVLKRFWNYVLVPAKLTECWEWIGPKNEHGYGIFYYNSKRVKAHRFSYKCYNGEFDYTLFVCHKCDNPSCINPSHLFLGTQFDNMNDMKNKGRSPRGEKSGTSKLTELDVKQILTDITLYKYKTILEITNEYDVKSAQIIRILNSKNWVHITKDFNIKYIKNILKSKQNTGENNPNSKLTEDNVRDIRKRLQNGETGSSIAKLYSVGKGSISEIKNFKRWTNVI